MDLKVIVFNHIKRIELLRRFGFKLSKKLVVGVGNSHIVSCTFNVFSFLDHL